MDVSQTTKSDGAAERAARALELRRSLQAIERWGQVTGRRLGGKISPVEAQLLVRLVTQPAQRMGELARWQEVDRSTMTVQIARLVERGYVEREHDPRDRRAMVVSASDEGRAVLDEHLQGTAKELRAALTNWSDEDLEAFVDALARFARDLEAGAESGENGSNEEGGA